MTDRTDTVPARTDAALAAVVFLAFVAGIVATGTDLSLPSLALGAGATVAFEAVASRNPEAVRRHWHKPTVRSGSVVAALALAVLGSAAAPEIVLSAGIGALAAYLFLLALARFADALSS